MTESSLYREDVKLPPLRLAQRRRAVIDIGSNSVRLVIYDGPLRAPLAVFNEKVLCGLGRREPGSNDLLPDAMASTLQTLERFTAVLDHAGNPELVAFATAAIREAGNGQEFVMEIRKTGINPVVLSGKEEARFAALGVYSGAPSIIDTGSPDRPHLCGDMGGGSLELTRYTTDRENPLAERISLPLGPLRLMAECGPDLKDAIPFVEKQLGKHDWLAKPKTETLYAVGGAWRAIAKVHMARRNYPLPILHHYQISRADAVDICALLERQSAASLASMDGVQTKRIETLPHAAMVMRLVIEHTRARRVIISSAGVREGVLFDGVPIEQKRQDPLITLATEYAQLYCPDPDFGQEAFRLTEGVIPDETAYERRIRQAACMMCDVAAYHHPDMRAAHASDMALRSPFTGIDHKGRVTLAAILYQRHCGKPSLMPGEVAEELLDDRMKQIIHITGLALRFAADFSPKITAGLDGCSFRLKDGVLTFQGPTRHAGLMGEVPRKRLANLAQELGVEAAVVFTDG